MGWWWKETQTLDQVFVEEMNLLALFTIVAATLEGVLGHGYLIYPPQRSSLWRVNTDAPANYDDNALFCGGFAVSIIFNYSLIVIVKRLLLDLKNVFKKNLGSVWRSESRTVRRVRWWMELTTSSTSWRRRTIRKGNHRSNFQARRGKPSTIIKKKYRTHYD